MRILAKKNQFSCSLCLKSFNSKFSCDVHTIIFRQGNPYRSVCKKWCRSNYRYHLLKRKHAMDRSHSCSTCSKSFNSVSNIFRHSVIFKHTQGRKNSNSTNLQESENNEETDYENLQTLEKSEKSEDEVWSQMVKIHFSDRPFECTECGKRFRFKRGIEKHIKTHPDKKGHNCPFCNKSFNHKSNMKKHALRMHKDKEQEIEVFKGKKWAKAGGEDAFILTGGDSKPYECSVCGMQFKCKSDATRHLLVHSREKPHNCPYCDKTFSLTGNLNKHTKKMHGLDMYNSDSAQASSSKAKKGNNAKRKRKRKQKVDKKIKKKGPTANSPLKKKSKNASLKSKTKTKTIKSEAKEEELNLPDTNQTPYHLRRRKKRKWFNLDDSDEAFIEGDSDDEFVENLNGFSSEDENLETNVGLDTIRVIISEETESGEKTYACSDCGYPSANPGNIFKHIGKVHKGRTVEKKLDPDLPLSFSPKKKSKSDFMGFSSKGKSKKDGKSPFKNTQEEEKCYKCTKCDYCSNFSSNIYKHYRKKHADGAMAKTKKEMNTSFTPVTTAAMARQQIILDEKMVGNSSYEESFHRRYQCPLCDYSSNYTSNVYKHIKRMHMDFSMVESGELISNSADPNQNLSYDDIKSVVKSSSTKKEKKLYQCPHCDYSCNYTSNVHKHMRKKHGDSSMVERDFFSSLDETGAYNEISNEITKQYQCPHCDYSSNFSGNIYKHMRRMHMDVVAHSGVDGTLLSHSANSHQNAEYVEATSSAHETIRNETSFLSSFDTAPALVQSSAPREVHKIQINNKNVSVLMNLEDIFRRRSFEFGNQTEITEIVIVNQGDNILVNQDDSIIVNQNDTHNIIVNQNDTHNIIMNQNDTHNIIMNQNDTHNIIVNQEEAHNIILNQEDAHNIILNQEGAHNIILNQDDNIEKRAAESLLNLSVMDEACERVCEASDLIGV